MHIVLSALGALALLSACAAAHAQAQARATLVGRESTTHVLHVGGFAIVGSHGEDGSPEPVVSLQPARLDVAGSHHNEGTYALWAVEYTHQWALTQAWGLDAQARSFGAWGGTQLATGGTVVGPDCAPCLPTLQVDAYNAQALDFKLDAATDYQFRSETTPGQWIDLLKWNDAAEAWAPVWIGAGINQGIAWHRSGTLDAGLYRVRNNRDNLRVNGNRLVGAVAWDWTMELPGATVSAVPEPGSAGLLLAGLGWLAWRRRHSPSSRAGTAPPPPRPVRPRGRPEAPTAAAL